MNFFTAHNRSFGQGHIFTSIRHSVNGKGEEVSLSGTERGSLSRETLPETESRLDRDTLDRDPPDRTPQTETPQTETPLHKDSLGQRPPDRGSLDRDAPDRDPSDRNLCLEETPATLDKEPPRKRPPWTETPPEHRPPGHRTPRTEIPGYIPPHGKQSTRMVSS